MHILLVNFTSLQHVLFIVIPTKDLISAGDVVLKDLKLKAEALNALKLPVTVKAGFVGTITLKVAFTITDCLPTTFWIWWS